MKILRTVQKKLESENIFIINENQIVQEQESFIKDFFIQTVSPALVTIILNDLAEFPLLKDTSGYLAVKLVMKPKLFKRSILNLVKPKQEVTYAVIEIPKTINRFVVLPPKDGKSYIMLLDDVIRHNLHSIF